MKGLILKLDTTIPFLKERMSFENLEFDYLRDKYKNISFNWKHWDNSFNNGNYLYATEGFITIPKNYDIQFIKENYKGLITPNSKFKNLHENELEIHLVNGPGYYNNFWIPEKDDFVNFNKKIHGICALNNIYHTGQPGDIVGLREPLFNSINIDNFTKHSFGRTCWGNDSYQGWPNRTPSSPDNLKVISKYKFCLCLEPMYHELWSYDWVTERIFDCFKAKTIPLYYGCYNIEDRVPEDLYVDLRKFDNINEAIISIKDLSEVEYSKQVEEAYTFQGESKIGNILEIEKVLSNLN